MSEIYTNFVLPKDGKLMRSETAQKTPPYASRTERFYYEKHTI